MTNIAKLICLLALLGATACTSPSRFDDEPTVDLNSQTGFQDPSALGTDTGNPGYFSSTIGDRVLFAVDQSTLSADARQTLESQANWLLDNRDYSVTIEGHADEQGTREYNLALGARRASAVQQYLIARGVAPSRLRTVTYGKERPLEICSEESCYAKNRRVVTVLAAGIS